LPIDDSAPRPDGDPLLVSIGRFEEYKGHHRLLRALPEILKTAPGARLELIGSGPFEPQLRQMAGDLGVVDKVTIRGFGPQERGAFGKVVSSADAVCLLSAYEAHPVAVMEALGTGAKALVADTSGLYELGEAGLATVIGLEASPREVAAAALAVAAAPKAAPPDLPTWDDCARDLLELYRIAITRARVQSPIGPIDP
jgi:glycosyltransferase involved in cell wall biosynthesis